MCSLGEEFKKGCSCPYYKFNIKNVKSEIADFGSQFVWHTFYFLPMQEKKIVAYVEEME